MTLKIEKKYKPYIIIFILLFCSFLFSTIFFLCNNKDKKMTFIFPSADSGKYIVEYRYLPKKPVQGELNLYVDEILLGSGVERTKKLFASGTKVESCFLRDNVLYLNLSDDLIQMGNGVIDIQEGIELLKKNIFQNFHKVHSVEVFVDGKYAYEYK